MWPAQPGAPAQEAQGWGLSLPTGSQPSSPLFRRVKPGQAGATSTSPSAATRAALFTYCSFVHHRGAVSRNYYVQQLIKARASAFPAINNRPRLFGAPSCRPEPTCIVRSQTRSPGSVSPGPAQVQQVRGRGRHGPRRQAALRGHRAETSAQRGSSSGARAPRIPTGASEGAGQTAPPSSASASP